MISNRLAFTIFFAACAAQIIVGAAESEPRPRVRIIASKNHQGKREAPGDANEACMLHNNDTEECLKRGACTALPMDNDILCLSKEYISTIIGAIAKGDAEVTPTTSTKKLCNDVPDGATCKSTRGCAVFTFRDKEICAPEDGGYDLSKQDLDLYLFESYNELKVNVGVEHLNVLDSSESRDQWNLFGGVLAEGNSPLYQLAGINYEIGNVIESGIGSRVTDDEFAISFTREHEVDNNVAIGLPFLSYSAAK